MDREGGVGVEGNEQVDILAKQTFRIKHVKLQLPLNKAEAKTFIGTYVWTIRMASVLG